MKVSVLACAAALGMAFASAAMAQTSRGPQDTGNMAYPNPLPQGNLGTTTVPGMSSRRADTGSTALSTPERQGRPAAIPFRRRPHPTDTGNMAYPTPLPQGNLSTTPVR